MTPETEPWALSVDELCAGYATRVFSPSEVIDGLARRIERLSPSLGAFTTLCLDRAYEEAQKAERQLARHGGAGALTGVPFAAKDMFDTAGVRTTYGSRIFATHVPDRDAAAVAAVRAAGGILMGKTQTHEFAWGITSVNEVTGSARNPWDPRRIAGGSSGGSAVALAARLIPLALGGDTGGSIRIPAAFCGVLGFKPTFGRIDTTGAWPLSPSLDHAGPMARTPQDLRRLFSAMQGSAPRQPKLHLQKRALEGVRIATCTDLHLTTLDSDVEQSFSTALIKLAELGATVEDRSLTAVGNILTAFGTIQAIEAARVHRDAGLFPRQTARYGRDVRARLEWGTGLAPDRYVAAAAERERLRARLGALLSDGTYLVSPVTSSPPVTIASELDGNKTGARFRSEVLPYTTPHNLVGFPSCAVRCGFDDCGLPIGLQISASPWRDWDVLDVVEVLWDATADVQARWPSV